MLDEGRAMLVISTAISRGSAALRSPCNSMLTTDWTTCWEGGEGVLSGGRDEVKPDIPSAASLRSLLVVKHVSAPCHMDNVLGGDLKTPGLQRAGSVEDRDHAEHDNIGVPGISSIATGRPTKRANNRNLMQGVIRVKHIGFAVHQHKVDIKIVRI